MLTVPFDQDMIKAAPHHDPEVALSPSDEEDLYRHYGISGDASDTRTDTGVDTSHDRRDRAGETGVQGRDTSGPTTDDAMTLSEERLNVGTEQREAGRARLRKHIVSENVSTTVPVSHEEVTVQREPITEANRGDALSGGDLTEEEHEVTLTEERAVVDKDAAVVRVRLGTETVTEQQQVDETVRKEQIDEGPDRPWPGRGRGPRPRRRCGPRGVKTAADGHPGEVLVAGEHLTASVPPIPPSTPARTRSSMSERNTIVRSLHDLGLAAWFGGSLAGAVAVNGAAADLPDPTMRLRVANAGWARWAPVNAAAIAAHAVGGAGILLANRGRVAGQRGVGASTAAKLVLTGAALAVTAYSGTLGAKLQQADGEPVAGGTDPEPRTAPGVARIQKQLAVCQWLIPALTGAITVLSALEGEQQRPTEQLSGVLAKPAQWLRAAA